MSRQRWAAHIKQFARRYGGSLLERGGEVSASGFIAYLRKLRLAHVDERLVIASFEVNVGGSKTLASATTSSP